MNEELMAFIQSLPLEQQEQAMAKAQAMAGGNGMPAAPGVAQQAPGMPPMPQQQPPQVDPKMGLPGQGNAMPGGPDTHRDFAGEGGVIGDQQLQAEALRGTATPEGVYTKNAGFVAANPLSHLATAVQRIRGNINAAEALEAKKKLSTDLSTNNKVNAQQEFDRKTKEEAMATELRNNRRGGTPMDIMAANAQKNDSNFL